MPREKDIQFSYIQPLIGQEAIFAQNLLNGSKNTYLHESIENIIIIHKVTNFKGSPVIYVYLNGMVRMQILN